jgi:tRNA nucleotidyltransferase (CCA-adding enzyme)
MQIILTHENTDFDGIAAMLGAWKLNPGALPVVPRRPSYTPKTFLATTSSASSW